MSAKVSYAKLITDAALALKGRKGASRVALKKYIAANNSMEVSPVYFRNALKKLVAAGVLSTTTGSSFKATDLAKPKPVKKKKAAKKKTTKKKATKKKATKKKKTTKKKATSKGSDYKIIKGKKYDKGMLDQADAAVAGAHDNVISMEEASKILKEALDGHVYTATEKATMKYIRDNYKFTDAADKLVRQKVASFAAKKAAKAKKASTKKKATKKKTTKKKAAPKKKTTKKKASKKK
jgi:hypothetical protein